MAITRKPKGNRKMGAAAADVDRLIAGGGSAPKLPGPEIESEVRPDVAVLIRYPADLNDRVLKLLKEETVKRSRTKWIEEAIAEKAQRDEERLLLRKLRHEGIL